MSNQPQETKLGLDEETKKAVLLFQINYVLLIFFPIVPLIVMFIKKGDYASNPVFSSHVSWILKTLLYAFLATILIVFLSIALNFVVPFLGMSAGIGYFVLIFWYLYRAIKGFLRICSNSPI